MSRAGPLRLGKSGTRVAKLALDDITAEGIDTDAF